MGISYGGISQLFVAATRPPSLAAITPLSVIDNTATTLYPGGILNTGFALSWAKDRVHDAQPASATGGQAWALKRIQGGDQTCKANQALHAEAVDLLAEDPRQPLLRARRSPTRSRRSRSCTRSRSPVFLACQWTDEQTGGHCPDARRALHRHAAASGSRSPTAPTSTRSTRRRSTAGTTSSSSTSRSRSAAALAGGSRRSRRRSSRPRWASPGVTLPDDPIQAQPDLRRGAAPRSRRCRRCGSCSTTAPAARRRARRSPGFEQSFARFPLPGTRARSWYLGAAARWPTPGAGRGGADAFTWNTAARPPTELHRQHRLGHGRAVDRDARLPLDAEPAGHRAVLRDARRWRADTAVVGAGALQAWIRSSAPDVDLQVTVSEVRPDGKETFVQNGWLRASGRKLDRAQEHAARAGAEPAQGRRRAAARRAASPKVTVPLYYQGHVYRAGSRIRVTIAAPGGDQPVWAFGEHHADGGHATVSRRATRARCRRGCPAGGARASTCPPALPPCPGLRGEPCRPYQPAGYRPGRPRRRARRPPTGTRARARPARRAPCTRPRSARAPRRPSRAGAPASR